MNEWLILLKELKDAQRQAPTRCPADIVAIGTHITAIIAQGHQTLSGERVCAQKQPCLESAFGAAVAAAGNSDGGDVEGLQHGLAHSQAQGEALHTGAVEVQPAVDPLVSGAPAQC